MMGEYPTELEQPGLLRDGRSILVRPVKACDEEAMLDFSRRLSRRTVAQRLLGPVPRFRRELLRQFVDVDYVNHLALVAFLDDQMIGVGRLIRIDQTDHAEVTFTIADEFQGLGLGTLLLDRLAAAAPRIGIYVFEADVLTSNAAMLRVFAGSGFGPDITADGHLQHVVLRVDPRAAALARMSRREHQAARRSLEKLLRPRAVAVVGANRRAGTIGHQILVNLAGQGFRGAVYPVNPAAGEVAGLPAAARVQDLPPPVDLAVVAVPPAALSGVISDCACAGVGAVVVITADAGGQAGAVQQRDLTRFVRSHGMRLVGPTSMGVLSMGHGSVLNATFASVQPEPGGVAMSSQSGPLGLAILDLARRAGLGFSCFVSIGAAADVSSNDLLEWWEDDPQTSLVLLYLEGFGNPRNFARIARRVAARKPIVAVIPGGDPAGGALLAQAGVIHTATLDELFDVALLLANQPVPAGPRVAIVTNAVDPGLLAGVACRANGLAVSELSGPTLRWLGAAGIRHVLQHGVVDLRPTATPAEYREALAAVAAEQGTDAVLVIFMPPLVRAVDEVAAAIMEGTRDAGGKPVVASFMSQSGLPARLRDGGRAIPSYVFPERAVAALGRAAAYGRWRREPAGVIAYPPGVDRKAARELLARAGPGWLSAGDSAALLRRYGITVAGTEAARAGDTARGVVRVRADPLVGPVISFGLAGVFSELFGDVATGVTPLTDRDARELLVSLRAFPLLTGAYRDDPGDIPAIEDTLLRLSALIEDLPAVTEVTIDPLLIGRPGGGVAAVSPAVRIGPSPG
jgi:acyl-CoA synthetase (NDP forming)/RimJ/RimL family protein N-acetyltransferase